MTSLSRFSIHHTRLSLVLGIVAVLLFARLTVRHVGESSFLADQVDQLEKYEAALRLEPEGLWGPKMSGTTAHAFGPFGALVFGVPVSLGLGIDAIHRVTSLALAITAGIALWQLLRLDPILGWTWFGVFTSMRMVWWDAAMFWVNTLLLPLGLLMLALFASSLRRPSLTKIAWMVLVLLLALQVHLVALVGCSIVLAAVVHTLRAEPLRSGRERAPRLVWIVALIAVALLPYVVAESKTAFRNTRAVFSHVDSAAHSTTREGRGAAVESLTLAADPMLLLPEQSQAQLAFGAIGAVTAIGLLVWRRRSEMLWLVGTAMLAVAAQALFFLAMNRPLYGLHYAILLAPWYAIASGAALAALVSGVEDAVTRLAGTALALVAIALLLVRAPSLADRHAQLTPWNYAAIVRALNDLCTGQSVQTMEGPGLVNELTPASDSVLQYLLKRGHTYCRYDAAADVLIAANRENSFDETLEVAGIRFIREQVLPPGLARYRRLAGGEP